MNKFLVKKSTYVNHNTVGIIKHLFTDLGLKRGKNSKMLDLEQLKSSKNYFLKMSYFLEKKKSRRIGFVLLGTKLILIGEIYTAVKRFRKGSRESFLCSIQWL
jgi:hypothetical protein